MASTQIIVVEVFFRTIPYLILSVVFILVIGFAVVFVNEDRKASQSLMLEPTSLPFLDAFFMQFQFFAGQGDVGSFVGQSKEPWEPEKEENYFPHQELVFLAYVLVTYVTNIILLNILIAVTGDVYDEYKEKARMKVMWPKVAWLWE